MRPSESYCALIGFFFLFLLAFPILNANVEYKNGVNQTLEYECYDDCSGQNSTTLEVSTIIEVDNYGFYGSRLIGLYLAILSGVGFAGVLFSLKKPNEDDD